MSYISSSVAAVLDQINRNYFLPAIQRPYVWQPEQIVALFDSLLKGYPISSFLFWEIRPERRGDWDIYRFVENFRFGETHSEFAETDGRDVVLVLDGQQRLTSLLIGLRGTYTVRTKYGRRNNPDAWSKQRLYLDLLQDPSEEREDLTDDEIGVTYGFAFFDAPPPTDKSHCWMKVGRVLDCTSDDEFDRLRDQLLEELPDTATRAQEKILSKTLERLYRTVWKDEVVSYYTERDQSYDRVLDIFIRANDGGTKLSKSDLLLSMITSKWEGVSAREAIYEFVDFLNDGLDGRNELDKDFVMKCCLVLSDLDVRYKVGNFTTKNLATIERNWNAIKLSLERTLRLANRFGIDRETLLSVNALLPVAYYLHATDAGGLDGSSDFEGRNSKRIHWWLFNSLLNGVFGGSSDQTIASARTILKKSLISTRDFPAQELIAGLGARGRVTQLEGSSIDRVLDLEYGKRTCFLALSLLYDFHSWGATPFHIDHIIPRSATDHKSLAALGLSESRASQVRESVNKLGNLQLLLARENLEKSNLPFERWFSTREPEFLNRNLIPQDSGLWSVDALPEFVAEREKLIRGRLHDLSGGFDDSLTETVDTLANALGKV